MGQELSIHIKKLAKICRKEALGERLANYNLCAYFS